MAQMPRGEPRSVPDPAGEKYDAMNRRVRMKRERDEVAAARSPLSFDTTPFAPSDRLDTIRYGPRSDSTVTVGGRTYRAIDNGRSNVLVPVGDPLHSAAERAEQRRNIERASFMASHPLAGAAYGIASLFNASPRVRDGARAAGGVLDAAMLGAALRGVPIRSPLTPPRKQPLPPTFQRPPVRYGDVNEKGQATRAAATLTPSLLGTGSRARRDPPGLRGTTEIPPLARGHLLANLLGGTGRDLRNLVALTQTPTNSPHMRDFEVAAAKRVRAGEVVEYAVTPFYADGILPPSAMLMTAHGTRQPSTARIVFNPAGRRR